MGQTRSCRLGWLAGMEPTQMMSLQSYQGRWPDMQQTVILYPGGVGWLERIGLLAEMRMGVGCGETLWQTQALASQASQAQGTSGIFTDYGLPYIGKSN